MARHDDDAFEAPVDLSALRRESPVPDSLEGRVVRALRAAGELRPGRPGGRPRGGRAFRWLAPLAASLAGFAVGWWARAQPAPLASDLRAQVAKGPLFLFVFSGGPQSGEGLTRSVLDNRDWARSAAAGRLVAAQKLLPSGRVLAGGGGQEFDIEQPRDDDFTPTGLFVIRARDLDEALALARTNPHLAVGGRITVRPIDDLGWLPSPAPADRRGYAGGAPS